MKNEHYMLNVSKETCQEAMKVVSDTWPFLSGTSKSSALRLLIGYAIDSLKNLKDEKVDLPKSVNLHIRP